jgi:hyperosmotically inducible protein
MKPFLSIALSAVAVSGAFLDDGAITGRIESELLDGEGIWTADIIHVETVQGVVHLSGYAATERNRQRAGEVAQSIAGVKQVENDIRVR